MRVFTYLETRKQQTTAIINLHLAGKGSTKIWTVTCNFPNQMDNMTDIYRPDKNLRASDWLDSNFFNAND